MKFKVGDIMMNHYAGPNNPVRISLVVKTAYRDVKTVHLKKGGFVVDTYERRVVDTDPKFSKLGHIDITGIVERALRRAQEENK